MCIRDRRYTVYHPPGHRAPPHEEWDALLDSDPPTIVAGDLNARAVEDDPRVLIIGPSEPTYFSRAGHPPDVLDIVIVKAVPFHLQVSAVSDLSSDHDPLLVTVLQPSVSPRLPDHPVRKVNWRSYHDDLARQLPSVPPDPLVSCDDVDLRVNQLQDLVQSAMGKHNLHCPGE